MTKLLRLATFCAGLTAVGWVGAGYVGSNPLALAVTSLIGAFYLMGALDLRRFQQATGALATAVAELAASLAGLGPWLDRLPPPLRSAVRRRVEGEPAGLPGPAMAPYLSGLLVLLGMLGTFLGMVLTLRGTGLALESASDLQAVRASLVAPVRGLGLAFGTSIAGVAASAALGLMSALCRRERVQAVQALDARIATTLRPFSVAHQREESLRLMQRQVELMPALVDGMREMMAALTQQSETSNAQLLARQERFHENATATVAGLAASIARTMNDSLAESARAAGATIAPVVDATMAGIARETAVLHETLAGTVQRQLGDIATRLESTTTQVADAWQGALARHERTSQDFAGKLRGAHDRFADTFDQRSAALLDGVGARHAEWHGEMVATMAALARDTTAFQERVGGAVAMQLDGVTARLDGTARHVTEGWDAALARHERSSEQASTATRESLAAAAGAFERHAASLLGSVERAHAELRTAAAAREEQRAASLAQAMEAMAATLQREWHAAGEQALAQQQRICETMERTTRDITTQAGTHARETAVEITRLLKAAAEAPRAAADVIAELRHKLSDSMAHDNSLLEERARMLETLGPLLDAVNRAAGEQRGAIDALVGSSAALLERAGARFGAQVDAQSDKLAAIAAQVTGSAVEVASLGEAFGTAVQLFSQSNDKLVVHLQRVDAALAASMSRSDDQLAYYVAQAREVIDLSLLSQKQIIEDLQRLASRDAVAS